VYKQERRHHHLRFLWMDVTQFVRLYVLRQQATRMVPGPRPAAHESGSGPKWDPSLATGIARVDREHEELLEGIRDFEKAVQQGSGHRKVDEIVGLLVRHAEDHFTLEESYMAHIKYPHLPAHREDHARLRTRVRYLQQRFGESDEAKALELSTQLCQYLRNHILKEDAAYADFARKG
jgi:hemerythrin-like metal-binding protein